jgi:hypothetical protein
LALPAGRRCATLAGMTDDGCVLCQLVEGRLEVSRVYEDERVVAFMDH